MAEERHETLVRVEESQGGVTGEVALAIAPGTRADAQRDALETALSGPLTEAAARLDLVLAARPSAFAAAQPGKDEQGRTRFLVRGRMEGDRLVPWLRDLPASPTAARYERLRRAHKRRG
jgi:hypothetical protein